MIIRSGKAKLVDILFFSDEVQLNLVGSYNYNRIRQVAFAINERPLVFRVLLMLLLLLLLHHYSSLNENNVIR